MAQLTESSWIWHNGTFIPWQDAQLHILAHSMQFGSAAFEGIRCYPTATGPAIFRLREHLRRLVESVGIYRISLAWDVDALVEACCEVVRRNGLDACYIRPMVLRGYGTAGLDPRDAPVEVYIPCWPWGPYLGATALAEGVDVCVSSWHRVAPNTLPATAKIAGNYLSSQLIKMEAVTNGYAEGIALGPGGMVSEGSGQNVFLIRDGVLVTPPLDGTLLAGITRDAVLTLARDEGLPVHERPVAREVLYTADELFFTGTAAEITPIRSVDRIPIGQGGVGPITRRIQERYLGIARGELPDPAGWLTRV